MRTLVFLLVGLPLLAPPGVCVCQFLPCGTVRATPSHVPAPVAAAPVATESDPDQGCCCKRRAAHTSAGEPASCRNAPAGSPRDRPPHSTPGKHLPGCPAEAGAAEPRSAFLPPPVQVDDDPSSAPFVLAFAPRLTGRPAAVPPQRHLAVPIFVTHCSLLI